MNRLEPTRRQFPSRAAKVVVALCIMVALSILSNCRRVPASDSAPSEYQVKALFLYHFTKFVEWPSGAMPNEKSPFTIGVVGKDPFGPELDKVLDGKTVDGRTFAVRRFRQAGDIQPCQLLFVSDSEADKFAKILSRLGDANTLTVSDVDGFLQRGGAINFLLEGDKVRFEINPRAAERAGLKVSAQLMKVAKAIRPDKR